MHFDINWKTIYNKNKKEHSSFNKDKYTDIDRLDLKGIEVYLKDKLIYTLKLKKNQRLIMRYRVQQDMMNPNKNSYVFLVGWQKTDGGKNTQEITYIYPDGRIEVSGKWDNSKILFCEPKLMLEEKGFIKKKVI